jgi:type VI secretion system secreted protein VgrG
MLPTERLPVTIDGPSDKLQLHLHWMTGHEELGRLFEYELEIYAENHDVKFGDLLGKPMTVCLSKQGGNRFFNGIVTRVRNLGVHDRYLVFRATVSPRLWLLKKTTDVRIYQNHTVPDVLKMVLREHAIEFKERLSETYPKWDYLTQYRESDFAFVSRLMERAGIYYYFNHTQSGHELVLSDSLGSHDVVAQYDKIPVRVPGSARTNRDHFTGWRVAHQVTSVGATVQAHDFRLRLGTDIKGKAGVPAEHDQDEFQLYDYSGMYHAAQEAESGSAGDWRTEGERYAKVQLDEQRTELERIDGEGDVRGLQVGALFQFDELTAPTDTMLTTFTQYELRNPAFESGGDSNEKVCEMSFSCLNSQRQFRPARVTEKPVVAGPETAVVVGTSGEEIHTDEHGRVRVQFHWDREGKHDEKSTCWVRVAQMWAGPQWGSIYIPRHGHEVVVQFLGGDPDRPMITGSVYNANNMPPYTLPENKTQSGIKSRSTKGGAPNNFNELRFEDKKGSEQVYIQAEKNQDNLVKADASLTVGHDRTKSIGNDETTTVGNNRTESVGVDEAVAIGANQTLTVGANRTKSVGANQTVTVGVNETITIGVNKTDTIGATKTVAVGGALILSVGTMLQMSVAAAVTEEVGAAKSVTVGAVSSEDVGGNKSVDAGGDISESAGGKFSITAGKDVAVDAGANMTAQAKDNFMVKAGKKALIEAADQLDLKCGSASIQLKKNGDIVIKGNKIKIQGSGDVIIKGSNILEN